MKKIWIRVVFSFFLFTLGVCQEPNLKYSDVQKVMNQFFEIHVEQNQMNAEIVKRSFKLYIERFDPEKIYLLQSEVQPYLSMSDAQVKKVIEHYKNNNFSDYQALNNLIQTAIIRSRSIREKIEQNILIQTTFQSPKNGNIQSNFAENEAQLSLRIRDKIDDFFAYQAKKTDLTILNKKEKAISLLEKRFNRIESPYIYTDSKGNKLSEKEQEHYFTMHLLKALSRSLDTHTVFFSEEEAYQMRTSLQKQFEGVGVVLSEGIDGVIITDLVKGGPADLSGNVKVDDLLVEIDGKSVRDLAFEEILDLMKKRGSTQIQLGLMRNSQTNGKLSQVLRVKLDKKPIVMEDDRISVRFETYSNGIVGAITLRSFYENEEGVSSEKDIQKAIRELEKHGPLLGLVLDLRENAGGFLSQAVKVAGLFIKSGVVVISKYAKNETHYLRTLDGKTAYNGPLIVLTSKLSASAAEIVAQSLQDYGIALVVGDQRTFGKGSIQYQTVTDENAALFFKITVGKYYTPSGKTTQLEGVKADILVPSVYSPYLIGEKYLEYPLANDQVAPALKDSLVDLDPKAKKVFEQYYIPNLQRVVAIWKNMLPTLKKNSALRIQNDKNFQAFLRKQKAIEARLNGSTNEEVLSQEKIDHGTQDIQMMEALNILKDMIYLEAKETRAQEFPDEQYIPLAS